jgi:hypothetical protein
MPSLIERIRNRVAEGRPNDYPSEGLPVLPPVAPDVVAAAEGQLGFRLPDLLRRLYTEVGNGGFGPVFGLVPLSAASLGDDPPPGAEFDLVSGYHDVVRRYAGDPQGPWPAGLVPAFYFGCTVFEFVDCRDPAGPVVGFDSGSEDLAVVRDGSRVVAESLERRLESWLAGEPVAW